MNIRYIFKCRYKACSHVFAHDYERDERFRDLGQSFRTLADGSKRWLTEDLNNNILRCPTCNSINPKGAMVNGRYSEKQVCGAKCMGATGPSCECSCAGRNHGAGHL